MPNSNQPSTIDIPIRVKNILLPLIQNGYNAYVVGGCVRDSLLGIQPHDWDICTNALPDQIESVYKDFKVIKTGLKHGTLTIVNDNESYEVTTFRKDGDYSDHRHPDSVQFVDDLKSDLSRRDFTINSMAADIDGNIIDYFKGKKDLKSRVIKCVGDPNKRFQEDSLRIIRALRFASKYQFHINHKTEEALFANKELLLSIAPERFIPEFEQILLSTSVYTILKTYHSIFAMFIPEIEPTVNFWQHNPHHYLDVWNHTVTAIYMSSKDIYIRLALLYHDLGKPQCFSIDDHNIGHFYNHAKISAEIAESSMRKLRFDNNTIEIVTQLVENHDREIQPTKTSVLRCLNKLGKDQFERLLYLKHADYLGQLLDPERDKQYNQIWEVYNQILSEESCFSLKDLEINGNDLISIGYTPGKKLGETLNHLLNLVIENNIPNRKQALLDKAYVLLEPSETCEFCKKFDFGSVRCDIGSFIPSIRFSGGSSRFPADKRFNYCPNCGRKLNHKTNQERDI